MRGWSLRESAVSSPSLAGRPESVVQRDRDQRQALPRPLAYSKGKKRNKEVALGDHLKQE